MIYPSHFSIAPSEQFYRAQMAQRLTPHRSGQLPCTVAHALSASSAPLLGERRLHPLNQGHPAQGKLEEARADDDLGDLLLTFMRFEECATEVLQGEA